jgi:hypothetical protein
MSLTPEERERQENRVTSRICTHGLNDRCVLSIKTVVTDYKMGVVTASYLYYCPDHNSYGNITVKTNL